MKTYDDDALNRRAFGDLLYGLLRSEFILADDSFVVALTGGFGAGKSYFLEIWEQDIRSKEGAPSVVHINAWESDHSGEPVLAIVSAIAIQLADQKSTSKKTLTALKTAAARVARGGVILARDLATGYIESKTGVGVEKALEAIAEQPAKNLLSRSALSVFDNHQARSKAIGELKKSLDSLVGDSGELRIILVVDELDRCRPTYAIDFLEAIKHLFNVKGLAVVLAVDWDQLSCTAKALFGAELDTSEYFRKFVTRKVPLPDPDVEEIGKLVHKLWERLVASESLMEKRRSSKAPKIEIVEDVPAWILISSGVRRPRQVEAIFRTLSHFLYAVPEASGRIGDSEFVLILVILSVEAVNPTMFDRVANGSATVEECLEFVLGITRSKLKPRNRSPRYVEVLLIEAFVDRNSGEEFKGKYLQKLSPQELESRNMRASDMPNFSLPYLESRMQILAMKLRSLKRFSDE